MRLQKHQFRIAGLSPTVLLAVCLVTNAAERGIGPFAMETRQGKTSVRLLRREGDILWILRQGKDGSSIEAGIAVEDIVKFDLPRPKSFMAAEQVGAADIRRVQKALHTLAGRLQPFRDLPGMIVDEALYLEGKLWEQQEEWKKALGLYVNVVEQDYGSEIKNYALLRAGLCRAQLGEYEQALKDLDLSRLPEDDPELLSEVCIARGDALTGAGEHEDAIMSYLYPVVFHPFVLDNEARGLGAALECYVKIEDWDAIRKTCVALSKNHPGTEAAVRAARLLDEREEEMERELDFQVELESEQEDDNAEKGKDDDS